jgi:hypothetical protein
MTLGLRDEYDHPSWLTIGGTVVGYGVILTVVLLLMFVVPYALWTVLG